MVTRITITIKLKSTGLFKGKFKENITKLTKLFTNRLRGARGKKKEKKKRKTKQEQERQKLQISAKSAQSTLSTMIRKKARGILPVLLDSRMKDFPNDSGNGGFRGFHGNFNIYII